MAMHVSSAERLDDLDGFYGRLLELVGPITSLDDLAKNGVAATIGRARSALGSCDAIWLTVDIDVLDLAFAPGCPGARPGGMTPRQLAAACRAIGRHQAVRAADFVEVDPGRDRDGLTAMNAASAFLAFVSGLGEREAP